MSLSPQLLGSHQGEVYALSLSPNGTHLASCGADRSVLIFPTAVSAAATPLVSARLDGCGSTVLCVRILTPLSASLHGVVALGTRQGVVKVWCPSGRRPVLTLAAHDGEVTAIDSPDAALDLGKSTASSPPSQNGVQSPSSPHGHLPSGFAGRLATCSSDGTCKIWNLAAGASGPPLVVVSASAAAGAGESPLTSLVFLSRTFLAVGTDSGAILLFAPTAEGAKGWDQVQDLSGHPDGSVLSLAKSCTAALACVLAQERNSEVLASGGEDGAIRLWIADRDGEGDASVHLATTVKNRSPGTAKGLAITESEVVAVNDLGEIWSLHFRQSSPLG